MKVEIFEGELLVTQGAKQLRIATAPGEAAEIMLSLDAIETWDPPGQGPEVTLEELQKIAAAVEQVCARLGIAVEFD